MADRSRHTNWDTLSQSDTQTDRETERRTDGRQPLVDRQRNAPTYGAMVCLSPLSSAFFSSPLPNSYSFFPTLPPHLAPLALGVFCEGKPFLEFSKAAKTGKSCKPTLSTLLTPLLAHVRARSLARLHTHSYTHACMRPFPQKGGLQAKAS